MRRKCEKYREYLSVMYLGKYQTVKCHDLERISKYREKMLTSSQYQMVRVDYISGLSSKWYEVDYISHLWVSI